LKNISFRAHLRGTSGNNFEEQLGTSFGALENISGAASRTSFGEQVSGTALGSSFANSFPEQLWGAAMRGAAFIAGLFQS